MSYQKQILLIAGDWNLTLSQIDKGGGQAWKATTYRNAVIDLTDEFNLTDIIYILTITPKHQIVYLRVKNLKVNFFLVSRPISFDVLKAKIRTSVAPDHKSVKIKLNLIPGLCCPFEGFVYARLVKEEHNMNITKLENFNVPSSSLSMI